MMRDKLPRKPLLVTSSRGASRLKKTSSECTAWRMLRTCSGQLPPPQGITDVLCIALHQACECPCFICGPLKSSNASRVVHVLWLHIG